MHFYKAICENNSINNRPDATITIY